MKSLVSFFWIAIAMAGQISAGQPATTDTGIPLDADWKVEIYRFASKNAVHVAWGKAHSERDYQVAMKLAEREGLKVDADVLFAAAFLHDIGAIPPFRKNGVEHEIRSVEIMEPLLKASHFPPSKIGAVKDVILEHMYYHESAPKSDESKVFHDADALDFLGAIGIIRIAALSGVGHAWAPSLGGAIRTLEGWTSELPPKLSTSAAHAIAAERIAEMQVFFEAIDRQTCSGKAL
jgi:uncharacterized protein